jgi:hypothetical protein
MDGLTLFGLMAVTAMLIFYALEDRSHWYVLAFAGACALASAYGFLHGACRYKAETAILRWIWDPKKAATNHVKHHLSFETAVRVFDDPLHASKQDPHPDGDRWQTIGLVGPVLLLVVHT